MKTLQLPLKNNKWNLNPNNAGFALSLMLHIALVLGLINGIKTINIQEEGQHSITMSLSSFKPLEKSSTQEKVVEKKIIQEKVNVSKKAPQPLNQETVTTNTSDNPTSHAQNDMETLSYKNGEQNEVFLKIKRAIDKNNKYPPMAQRNGIEGEVLMSFVLDQSGEIIEIKVLKESKHKMLNKAAIKAIKSAKGEFPHMDRATRIEIEIAYKII